MKTKLKNLKKIPLIGFSVLALLISSISMPGNKVAAYAAAPNFYLDPGGITTTSNLYWPFPGSEYATFIPNDAKYGTDNFWRGVTSTPNTPNHYGSDQFAQDWQWMNGSTTLQRNVCGVSFYAPLSGSVLYANNNSSAGYGYQVVIRSSINPNFVFRIAHFDNPPAVQKGSIVTAGALLGQIGTLGASTGCHAHTALYDLSGAKDAAEAATLLTKLNNGEFLGGYPNIARQFQFNATRFGLCTRYYTLQYFEQYLYAPSSQFDCYKSVVKSETDRTWKMAKGSYDNTSIKNVVSHEAGVFVAKSTTAPTKSVKSYPYFSVGTYRYEIYAYIPPVSSLVDIKGSPTTIDGIGLDKLTANATYNISYRDASNVIRTMSVHVNQKLAAGTFVKLLDTEIYRAIGDLDTSEYYIELTDDTDLNGELVVFDAIRVVNTGLTAGSLVLDADDSLGQGVTNAFNAGNNITVESTFVNQGTAYLGAGNEVNINQGFDFNSGTERSMEIEVIAN